MFYERLKTLCEGRNMKISTLLNELSMSPGNLTRWKNGTVPDGNTLKKLAQYFDVTTDYLLGIDDTKKKLLELLDDVPDFNDPQIKTLARYFVNCDLPGQFRIIQIAMNEYDRTIKEKTDTPKKSVF